MPRSNIRGRPRVSDENRKYNFSIRLTDKDRGLLEKKFDSVQKAIDTFLKEIKDGRNKSIKQSN